MTPFIDFTRRDYETKPYFFRFLVYTFHGSIYRGKEIPDQKLLRFLYELDPHFKSLHYFLALALPKKMGGITECFSV